MSAAELMQAGTGKSIVDNLRGLGQSAASLGSIVFSPEDVLTKVAGTPNVLGDAARNANDTLKAQQAEANQRDAPLMNRPAGIAGYVLGQGAQAVGAGTLLKGAGLVDSVVPTTYRGAASAGAAQGAIQPLQTGDDESVRARNAAVGGVAGVIGQAVPSAVGAGLRTIRGLIDPLTESGQGRILANTIAKFGAGGNLTPTASAVPGVRPTLAEATGNAGLGQLQRAVTDAGAGDGTTNAFAQRALENNAARVNAVRGVAGSPDDLAQAVEQRQGAADALYGKAASTDAMRMDVAQQAAKDSANAHMGGRGMYGGAAGAKAVESNALRASPELEALAKRPSFQQAAQQAKQLAADQGVNLGDPTKTVQGLHYIKLALDDMMQPSAASAIGRNQQSALQGTKQALLDELEKISPLYAQAKGVYQQMSKPVNAMQTGQAFLDKASGNVADSMGNPTLTANRFAGNLKSLDAIAQKATGFKGAKAEQVFTPDQLAVLKSVNDDLGRKSAADSVGKSAGSNTVQNLASQSLLGELTKATGINGLQSNGTIARMVRPLESAYKLFGAPDEIRGKLAQLMLNPESAESRAILARVPAKQRNAIERALAPYTGFVGQQAGVSVGK